jgi:hypothetical protein
MPAAAEPVGHRLRRRRPGLTLDWLLYHSHTLLIQGESSRLRQNKRAGLFQRKRCREGVRVRNDGPGSPQERRSRVGTTCGSSRLPHLRAFAPRAAWAVEAVGPARAVDSLRSCPRWCEPTAPWKTGERPPVSHRSLDAASKSSRGHRAHISHSPRQRRSLTEKAQLLLGNPRCYLCPRSNTSPMSPVAQAPVAHSRVAPV